MATHSSILAWRIPGTEKPGGLQYMGLQRDGHNCATYMDGSQESFDKTWSTGEGNGKPLHYSCLENPMNSMKRQKDNTLKDELPRVVGA